MTRVFVGGSREISRLNDAIREQLDELVARRCSFFVGDASGADKAIQGYLADIRYSHVTVYCTEVCRHNLGNWSVRVIEPPHRRKDFEYYSAKDRVMAEEARCGLMLWEGRSRGTLENILNLIDGHKRVRIYLATRGSFYTVASESDLRSLLAEVGAPLNLRRQIALSA